ncbi:hypothetical protein, partial [Pseudomonas tolaasii]|uniref:hypothetical protein n=1 Tax=Pseudomonas tolaasii TaxID=29442 RepID=UPI0005B40C39
GGLEGLIAGKLGSHTEARGYAWHRPNVGAGLPAKAPVQSTQHLSGAKQAKFKRQTVPVATAARLYDRILRAGMPAATP